MSEAVGSCKEQSTADMQLTVNGEGTEEHAAILQDIEKEDNAMHPIQPLKTTTLSGCSSEPNLMSIHHAGQAQPDLLQDSNTSPATKAHDSSGTRQSSPGDDKEYYTSSRIPRIAGLKTGANTSATKGNRVGSSIPIPIHRRSAEHLRAALQGRQSEPSLTSARLVEKPRGPRPRPKAEQTALSFPESTQETEQESGLTPPSATSSSGSSWDFKDIGDPDRPETVFTGEYRTRILGASGHRSPGPTLKIASSAEDIIMGGVSGASSSNTNTNTHRSTPSLIKRLGKLTPSTPKGTNSLAVPTPGSRETAGSKDSGGNSQGSTPTRNFCRPQLSLDNIPRRDISAKEMSLSRKLVNRPSLINLFSPSSKSLRSEEEPNVPKIPEQYFNHLESGMSQVSNQSVAPETPAKVESNHGDSLSNRAPENTPIPETVIRVGTISPHPPRVSSLQALSHFSEVSGPKYSSSVTTGGPLKVATDFGRNVKFNEIAPFAPGNESFYQGPGTSRLPESKSNHHLERFRNIFRSRSGTADKERIKKENIQAPIPLIENRTPNTERSTAKNHHLHNDYERSPKSKPKYTRLSGGVSWNRSSRNPRNKESPTTPTPSVPRLLAPPHRIPEENIPSFASHTESTRTKASPAQKGQPSVTPDSRARRPHVRTASTGSPHRLPHGPGRAINNILMPYAQKRSNRSPKPMSVKVVAGSNLSARSTQPKNLDAIRHCLETLCKRIGEASSPLERDRHIRLALRLQQQLGDYQSIEKAALEAESLAEKRLFEKQVAEETLSTSLAEAQAQIEMD
ncbi:uncharacterized protein DSM5745_01950 [Aspergillus mulundensis]|uniref:Uncharacterized protein n=1 Tax=Aspergillus mulundensis TaxID=1810919 RepID=A0A3D8SV62_9EURO|nr:hypothetical protein DSM5745_01950 [Aspergillus mulundensis]RDW90175.1 hypothetical protein DSM5745_01950 [Aspergillus mulundensis]